MRDYGKVAPTFWARGSGKNLRGDPCAQVLALYLFTAPGASMSGLFYISVPVICHETGLSPVDFAFAICKLDELGIAHYDDEAELVWVPEMARYQIGAELYLKDKRIRGVEREVAPFAGHAFHAEFVARYKVPFNLSIDAPEPPARTPREAAPKAPRCQEKIAHDPGLKSGAGSLPDPSELSQGEDPVTAGACVAPSVPAQPAGGQATLGLGEPSTLAPARPAKPKTHRESASAAERGYGEAFAAGQTDASGLPFTPPTDNGSRYAFRTGLATHAVDANGTKLRGEELKAWIRQTSADYRRAKPSDALYGGFTPRGMFTWLNGGRARDGPAGYRQPSASTQATPPPEERLYTHAGGID